jgi:hypothetical protein
VRAPVGRPQVSLIEIKRTEPSILADMAVHYSRPGGFVGRNICYAIEAGGHRYGHIVGGSSTLHLVGRDAFFGLQPEGKKTALRTIINNIFFHIEPRRNAEWNWRDGYPVRNMGQKVLRLFRETIAADWTREYGDPVIGFETLVELPRTGEVYKRDRWVEVGTTKGQTCKRVAGKGTDSWTGKRVWNVKDLRPKRVFCIWAESELARRLA